MPGSCLCLALALAFALVPVRATPIVGPWEPIFKGIDHSVSTNLPSGGSWPSRHVVHAFRVDLSDPDIRLFTTPRHTNYVAGAREVGSLTVSDFLRTYRVQAAMNANFFDLRNYYLPAWTPMNLFGLEVSSGVVVSVQDGSEHAASLVFDAQNRPRVIHTNWPPASVDGIFTAVTGNYSLLAQGRNVTASLISRGFGRDVEPRTAFGISQDGRFLYLVGIDGRQPGYSDGAYDSETAQWLLLFGAYDAINLDGGGSTTVVIEDSTGVPVRLNRSSAVADSGRERTVGGHFGVYAKRLPGFINDVVARPDDTTARITWTTVEPSTTELEYGATTSLGTRSAVQLGFVTNHVLQLDGLTPKTVYYFRAVSSDSSGRHISPTFSFVTTNYVTTNIVFELTNSWKYTTTPFTGRDWTGPAYDDAAWSGPGPGLLWVDVRATGPNPAVELKATQMPASPSNGGYPCVTYYFRSHFVLPKLVSGGALAFSGYIDDGAVLYINGTEVYRLRMPANSNATTLALGYPCAGDATCPDEFMIPMQSIKSLVAGDNVLAVEVHNYNLRSGDITFGLALSRIEPIQRSAKLDIRSSGETITLSWTESGFVLQSANAMEGPWTDVAGSPVSPFTVAPQQSSLYFRLRK